MSYIKVYEGLQFHKVVVLSRAENKTKHPKWNCLCTICDEQFIAASSQINSNKVWCCLKRKCKALCGNPEWEDYVYLGREYPSFIVINDNERSGRYWAQCKKFGHEFVITATTVAKKSIDLKLSQCPTCDKNKKLTSRTDKYNSNIKMRLYKVYEIGAIDRGLAFELSYEEFLYLIEQNCVYCGDPPGPRKIGKRKSQSSILVASLDRVNNDIGYVPGNVVPSCIRDNRMKMAMSPLDFINQAFKIVAFQEERQLIKEL